MKKIAIFTTTRAEFGIFIPLINALNNDSEIELFLFVGGTHISQEHGKTISEIHKNNFTVTKTFDYLLNEDSPFALAKSSGIETIELAHIFNDFDFDAVCVLGDRYELLPIVQNALLFRKPIIHLHGGEKTEGAIDEQIRHMITKVSHIHFAACEEYAQNILKMGEEPFRVFNTGALAVDNMRSITPKDKKILFDSLNLNDELPTIILTYHPVTLEADIKPQQQIENIFKTLESFDLQVMITAPNIDSDRTQIMDVINKYIKNNENYHYTESLGAVNFHNLVYYSEFVIGNSSSGIVEVPFFKKPTVNVGDRQKGRILHESIINTDYSVESIHVAIEKARSPTFFKQISTMKYKFGDGNTAKKMLEIIKSIKFDNNLLRKKLSF